MVEKTFKNYRVLIDAPNDSEVFVITFDNFRSTLSLDQKGVFEEPVSKCFVTSKGLNRIYLQTQKNDWYQRDGITEALEYIRSIKGERIYITYGNSMGGFAAVEYAAEVNAEYFVALSPQCTINNEFMAYIGDSRWSSVRDYLMPECNLSNRTLAGRNFKQLGVVLCDPDFQADYAHAHAIVEHTKAELITCRGAWHHTGLVLNQELGIMTFISRVAKRIVKSKDLAELVERTRFKIHTGFAHSFMNKPDARKLIAFLKYNDPNSFLARIKLEAIVNSFKLNPSRELALLLLLLKKSLESRKRDLAKEIEDLVLGLSDRELSSFVGVDIKLGFYDKYKNNFLERHHQLIPSGILFSESCRLESIGDIQGALFCVDLGLRQHADNIDLLAKKSELNKKRNNVIVRTLKKLCHR